MNVHETIDQRARIRFTLLLAVIAALSIALAVAVIGGPRPSERPADVNPFGRPLTEAASETSSAVGEVAPGASPRPALGSELDAAAGSRSGPRAELDTAMAFAPQAAVAPWRPIQLLGADLWDAVSAANVQQAMSLLPASLQAQLGNPLLGPIKVLVNTEGRTSSGYQPYGKAANFFSTNEARNEVVLYPQQSVFTILHELGHAYNLRRSAPGNYATVLVDPEMQSFMAISGWQVLTPPEQVATMYDHSQIAFSYTGALVWASMSRVDPLEDFANSFAMYFVNPGDLAARSPERHAWFFARFGP